MRIAIAGAGVVGAAIAYELSQVPGLELSLFEAHRQPATGATGSALGVMMGVVSHKVRGRAWQLRQHSVERYDTLVAELEAQTGQSIPYNRQGILALRFEGGDRNPERWQTLQAKRREQGYPLELWDRETVIARCPQVTDPQVCGAVYSPRDRQVDPVALTQTLLSAAQGNGVQIHYDTPVERDPESGDLACKGEAIAADAFILTAGLGVTQLLPSLDLRPVLGQALRLKLPRSLGQSEFQPVITGQDVLFVPLGEGRYWLGATVEFPDEAGQVEAQVKARDTLWQTATTICPAIANAEIEQEWSGLRPRPWGQGAPVIQSLEDCDRPTLIATGHYRNGVLLAPGTAQIVKQWVLNLS